MASVRRFLVALLGMALVLPGAAAADARDCDGSPHQAGAWPVYGRDLGNSRYQAEETGIDRSNAATLTPVWTFSSHTAGGRGDFTGTPVVARGCVFVGSNMGWVYAIDADDGRLVWSRQVPNGGVINNSLAVHGDALYAFVSVEGSPYVAAFDASDGDLRWTTVVDEQQGADAFASPVVFDGVVFVGISGDAAQHGDQGERLLFFGSFVLLDAASGDVLRKTYTIPPAAGKDGFAGGTVTTTPAIDVAAKVAYAGTGSPFRPRFEHPMTNALIKIDLNRESPTFGEIIDSYKGDTFDAVVPGYSTLPCEDLPTPPPPPIVPGGRGIGACGDVDVDFAASPNLFTDAAGRALVGSSQKSGRFHAVTADGMDPVWVTSIGPAQPFGGVSAAFDGKAIYGGAAPPGYLVSLDPADGAMNWASPVADGAHYGLPVAAANGVVYTLDVKGFLDAYDARTGVPLLHRPLWLGARTDGDATFTFGGVSVAHGTVFAAVGLQNTGLDPTGDLDGHVIAFRPGGGLAPPGILDR